MTCNDEASVDPWMKALEARFRRADSHNYDLVFSTKSIRTGRIEQEDGGIRNQRRRGKPLAHSEQRSPLNHLQMQYRQAGQTRQRDSERMLLLLSAAQAVQITN